MNEWILYCIIWFVTVVLWCIGGQCWKPARRYIIPVLSYILLLTKGKNKSKVKSASILSLIGVNSMGYGETSFLYRIFGSDKIVRLVYSILVSLPFILLLEPIPATITVIATILAFQLRLGSLKLFKYDLLFEDVARASALALGLILCVR